MKIIVLSVNHNVLDATDTALYTCTEQNKNLATPRFTFNAVIMQL